MATVTSWGYTDSVSTTKNIAIPDLSYGTDFAVTRDEPDEVIISNRTSPLDQPETMRFGYQGIANIYQNTGIDPSFMSVSKRGVSLVAQVNDILRVENTVTASNGSTVVSVIDLPISAHVVLRIPLSQYIVASDGMKVVNRAVSSLYATGSTGDTRLEAMLRHALKPATL